MKYVFVFLLLATPAYAEEIDVATLSRYVKVLQAQRNQALDALTISDSTAVGLRDDLKKANDELEKLQKETEKCVSAAPKKDH